MRFIAGGAPMADSSPSMPQGARAPTPGTTPRSRSTTRPGPRDAASTTTSRPTTASRRAAAPPRVPVHAELVSNRVFVAPTLFAAGEMQISGEPFASGFAGRNLADYDPSWLPPDEYLLDLGTTNVEPILDLFGFSTAVESYEYSKYHMNMVVLETTAGVSLANGPVVAGVPGATPFARAPSADRRHPDLGRHGRRRLRHPPRPHEQPRELPWLARPLAVVRPLLRLRPDDGAFVGHHDGVRALQRLPGCLSLGTILARLRVRLQHDAPDQSGQPGEPRPHPRDARLRGMEGGPLGHRLRRPDPRPRGQQVSSVAPDDLPLIGTPGNTVQRDGTPERGVGTYIGSSPVEGMWGLTMLADMDNGAEWLRSALLTSDGAMLSGISGANAMAYDYRRRSCGSRPRSP